jgi:predicted permease
LLSSPSEGRAAIRELHDKIKALPGVEAISVAGGSLPMNSDSELPFWLEGQPKPVSDNEKNWALLYLDQPDYLKAMGIPLQRGRFFTSHDDEHSALVAVVDDAFARKYYPNQDPVGKRLSLDLVGTAEIIGVVGHIKQWGLDASTDRLVQAQIHVPVLQTPDKFMPMVARGMTVVVRTNGSPLSMVPSIRQVVGQMNNEHVMYNVQTMDTIISWSLGDRRFSMILLALFASLALILASVGIYGVISYTVGQRTREIGIRIALGARQHDVLRSILGQGAKMALTGVAIGIVASLALARLMSTMLYGVGASDPLTFLGVAVLLMLVALGACYIPARRAMHVDPVIALRYE